MKFNQQSGTQGSLSANSPTKSQTGDIGSNPTPGTGIENGETSTRTSPSTHQHTGTQASSLILQQPQTQGPCTANGAAGSQTGVKSPNPGTGTDSSSTPGSSSTSPPFNQDDVPPTDQNNSDPPINPINPINDVPAINAAPLINNENIVHDVREVEEPPLDPPAPMHVDDMEQPQQNNNHQQVPPAPLLNERHPEVYRKFANQV